MGLDDDEQLEKDAPAVMASEYRVRARFYAIRQVDGEPAYDWYRRVWAAAVPCGFGVHRLSCAVADKFVTGLRPGPVADRLLGERADGRPDDVLAAAVEAEKAGPVVVSVRDGTTGSRDVLAEIREGLKMYRYSSSDVRANKGHGGGGDANTSATSNDNNSHKTLRIVYNEKTPVDDNTSLKLHEKSWWKNKIENNSNLHENNDYSPLTCKSCCNLATKLLESLEEKISFFHHQPNKSENPEKHIVKNYNNNCDSSSSSSSSSSHDDSKCYCSRTTNSEFKKKNIPISKSKKPENQIPRCLDYKKKTECCVCSITD